MSEEAILLTESDGLSSQHGNLAKLLDFFGVFWRAAAPQDLLGEHNVNGSRLRLFCSSEQFSLLIAELGRNSERARQWREQIHSAFVYAGKDLAALDKLVKTCPGSDNDAFTVSDKLPDFCGIMAGIQIAADDAEVGSIFASPLPEQSVAIVSTDRGAIFVKRDYEGVPVFLSSCGTVIDLETELPAGIFDVRHHVTEAIPPVLYIRWAFANTSWTAPERSACLVIDDPLLKPKYGFIDYSELLSLMQRYKFSTNIAFIPWNWRRSDPQVVRLFRQNPDYYSISVHGCAHTRAEFGSDDSRHLYGKAKQALEQMSRHELATGIVHDRVMVFPQGVFSEAAMSVLKRTDLIASVNGDTISSSKNSRNITVADVWDTAIMAYSTFALYTRRYPWSGIENFAFDSLLGKPIIIVVHHDVCREHCIRLIDFIKQLNSLAQPLVWRSLGELVTRSCRQRVLSPDVTQVQMYGKELRIENPSERTKHFLISRCEREPSTIVAVLAGDRQVSWKNCGDRIQFELELKAGENVTIGLRFQELEMTGTRENLSYKARTMLRRYLCELRDNYIHRLTSFASNGH